MKRPTALLLVLLLAGCSTPTPTPLVETASLTSSPSASRSPTAHPPSATPSPRVIEGTLTVQVNARSGPDTTYASLGLIAGGERIRIVSRNTSGSWYQIQYPSAPDGLAWVAAAYVRLAAGTEVPLPVSPTPSGPSGTLLLRLNVRGGPGTSFDSLGMLEAGTVVALLGKNSTASWFEIPYPGGPNGTGWVTAQYVQTDSAGDLPVLDAYGSTVTPPSSSGTPAAPEISPTGTVGPAWPDEDSESSPAVQAVFSPGGSRQFSYASAVSAPEGDPADWIEFTPYSLSGGPAWVYISLECAGNGILEAVLTFGSDSLAGSQAPACGDRERLFRLPAGQAGLLRLQPQPGESLQLVVYRLTVRNGP